MKNIRGLSMQLLKLILLSGLCAVFFFVSVRLISNLLIDKYFTNSKLQAQMNQKRIESFSAYISKNSISATDTDAILKWCDKQPMVLMEIYRDNILYFNSNYYYSDPLSDQNIEATHYNWYSYYELQFSDGAADVLVYSDESYVLHTWITITAMILSGMLFIVIALSGIRKTIRYIYLLCDEIQIMSGGDLEHPISVRGNDELGLLAKELDNMRIALSSHQKKEQEMIKQNNDMITSLSHDLRTPLTKLILYTEIIQNDKCRDDGQLHNYLRLINEKGSQIKEISEHLLKYSLSHGDHETLDIQSVSFREVFFDRLSEMIDYLSANGFMVQYEIEWTDIKLRINELFIARILDNLVSNIEKYADIKYPIQIHSYEDDHYIGITIKNMLSQAQQMTESFGVGIDNINSMMDKMDGKCTVERSEKTFEIRVLFPKNNT